MTERCPTCGGELQPDASQCGTCGQVLGEANRCAACGALAAANEVSEGRLMCAACGAPRPWLPGTVIGSSFASELTRQARTAGLFGTLARVAAIGLGAFGVSVGGLQGALDWGSPALTIGLFIVASAGLFAFGGRFRARRTALLEQAFQRKLVSEVSQHGSGATAARVASALAQPTARVDESLTALAKQGRLDLDVDDAGTIRYRVVDEAALELETSTPSSATEQSAPKQTSPEQRGARRRG